MHGAPVQRDAFDAPVGGQQDRPARRLVDAARLHTDEAVFDQVQAANAIVVAELVELGEQGGRRHRHAVDGDRIARLEVHGEDAGLVRRVLRRQRAHVDELRRLDGGVLQHLALGGRVQKVCVNAERRLAALVLGNRDLVLLREVEQGFAAFEVPFAPGRHDADIGLQGVVGDLEADLVVALAGGAVGDGVGAGLARNLDLLLGDQRARDRGAQQVLALIDRVGAEHREDVVADKLLAHVFDEGVLRLDAERDGLGPRGLDLLALAQVGGEGHDLCAQLGLQPLDDSGAVEPARVGQNDFLDGLFGHGAAAS